MKRFAVIMAGGLGARFWPRSTERTPKQFIHLLGDGTMIQNTYQRLGNIFDSDDIYVVVNESYSRMVREQLPEITDSNIIVEPFGRNTAPALGLVVNILREKYSDEDVMLAFPADQIISNLGEFYQSVELAVRTAVSHESIVTIGINPTRPETQFGYIQFNENNSELAELYDSGVRCATTFAEKPDKETARRFIESGDFIWNSGIFVMRRDTFCNAYRKYLPYYYDQFESIRGFIGGPDFSEELEKLYMKINPISMDYGILEKADNVMVVKSAFAWSDLGNWDELFRLSMKDARNNLLEGDVVTIESQDSFISSNGKLIAAIGIDNLIVIDSPDALLICRRGKSEKVAELVEFMRKKQITNAL